MMKQKKISIQTISLTALMAALCYIGFTFFKIDIPLGAGTTAIHFGNTFCVLAALMLGGWAGGLAGAIGMGIGDLFNPLYVTYFPKTFILKLGIGLTTGLLARKVFHINSQEPSRKLTIQTFISAGAGMLFNVIGEPVVSYLYNNFILKVPSDSAMILASWTAATTLFNAVTSVVIASLLYLALRKALQNSSLKKTLFPS